jgi:hypothetical protein
MTSLRTSVGLVGHHARTYLLHLGICAAISCPSFKLHVSVDIDSAFSYFMLIKLAVYRDMAEKQLGEYIRLPAQD